MKAITSEVSDFSFHLIYLQPMTPYSDLLREWRKSRRLSQLDLAVEADVSARHISFLETGRSRPSPDMVVHLSEIMNIPVDARNQMMRAAGFAPHYSATPLDDVAMAPILEAVLWTLERHAPYPGIALDRRWRIVKMNDPAAILFAPLQLKEGDSLLDLLTNPMMEHVVENWPEVAYYTMLRLRAESAMEGGIAELETAIGLLAKHASLPTENIGSPVIPTIYRFGDQRLSLFGTISQFSTVADETVDDLKIELFFPADPQSAEILKALVNQRS